MANLLWEKFEQELNDVDLFRQKANYGTQGYVAERCFGIKLPGVGRPIFGPKHWRYVVRYRVESRPLGYASLTTVCGFKSFQEAVQEVPGLAAEPDACVCPSCAQLFQTFWSLGLTWEQFEQKVAPLIKESLGI